MVCLARSAIERPQIALVDVNLSHGNGLDLVRKIRREPEIKRYIHLDVFRLEYKKGMYPGWGRWFYYETLYAR